MVVQDLLEENTFADSLLGADLGAIFHDMEGEVYLRDRLLVKHGLVYCVFHDGGRVRSRRNGSGMEGQSLNGERQFWQGWRRFAQDRDQTAGGVSSGKLQ